MTGPCTNIAICRAMMVFTLACLQGCEKDAVPGDSRAQNNAGAAQVDQSIVTTHELSFDFGEVSIDRGTAKLEHTFRISNSTISPIEIKDIKKSCGCLVASTSANRIEPGGVVSATVGLELRQAGHTTQSATIICADGRMIPMRVMATGTRQFEFEPILIERIPVNGQLEIRFQLIGQGELKDVEFLEVVSPSDVSIRFGGWNTIERASTAPGRPTRLIGSGQIDLSSYRGTFPARITFRAGRLVERSFEIGEPIVPGCRPQQ